MKQGVVGYVSPGKEYRGKKLYSFKLQGDETWYGLGENVPTFGLGDMVRFECNDRGNVDMSTLQTKKGEAPVSAPAPTGNRRGGGGNAGREKYWEDKAVADEERQKAISFQAARNTAVSFLDLASKVDALPLPKTANKRYDALMALLEEATVKFYNDTQNLESIVGAAVEETEDDGDEPEVDPDFNDDLPEWE